MPPPRRFILRAPAHRRLLVAALLSSCEESLACHRFILANVAAATGIDACVLIPANGCETTKPVPLPRPPPAAAALPASPRGPASRLRRQRPADLRSPPPTARVPGCPGAGLRSGAAHRPRPDEPRRRSAQSAPAASPATRQTRSFPLCFAVPFPPQLAAAWILCQPRRHRLAPHLAG